MAATRKNTSKLTETQQATFEAVMAEFREVAGWEALSEERLEQERAAIDEHIETLLQRVETLKVQRDTLQDRDKQAEETALMFVRMIKGDVSKGVHEIVRLMCVHFDVQRPRKRTPRRKLEIATELLDAVLEVLDYEGMTAPDVLKALPDSVGVDAPMLRKILLALVEAKKVVTEGERRGKKYLLVRDEPQDEFVGDEDEVEEGDVEDEE